jgi:hypothetical protein
MNLMESLLRRALAITYGAGNHSTNQRSGTSNGPFSGLNGINNKKV